MKFLDIAKKRYSCRSYLSKPVENEDLMKILEVGRVAPTGCNRQPQRIIVVQSEEGLNKIKKAANTFGAPMILIVCGDSSVTWKRAYDGKNIVDIDISIVTTHMMLQATELGLGSLWMCSFKPDIIKDEFNIPKNLEPINLLAIGYESGEIASPERHNDLRKPLKDTVSFEKY
ncbi:MAG: nitroreductase family protein [Clostridia bacterium]|jgi:nitroreductase